MIFHYFVTTGIIIPLLFTTVKKKPRQNPLPRQKPPLTLLLPERLAVGTLVHSGVHLVGTHHNAVQRAVVLTLAMMSALLDGTLNALVGTIHMIFLLCLNSNLV